MIEGTTKSIDIISVLDEFVQTISKKTILVLDNTPRHSKAFKKKILFWKSLDLYIYFLPPYSPELDKIEILWRFTKHKWPLFDAFLNFNKLKDRLNLVL